MANFSTRLMKAAESKPNEIERRWLLSPLPLSVACEAPNLRSTEMELDQRKAPQRYLGEVLGPLLWWNGTLLIPPLGPMWHLCEEQAVRIGIIVSVEEVRFGEGFFSWRRCLDGEDLPRDL